MSDQRCPHCEAGAPFRPTANVFDHYHVVGDVEVGVRYLRCSDRSREVEMAGPEQSGAHLSTARDFYRMVRDFINDGMDRSAIALIMERDYAWRAAVRRAGDPPPTSHESWDAARDEWSKAAFPGRGPCGPMLHLLKEVLTELLSSDAPEWSTAADSIYRLVEALVRRDVAAFPLDELADLEFLVHDARSRSGYTYEQFTTELWRKLEVNRRREWPQGRDDGRPVEHKR